MKVQNLKYIIFTVLVLSLILTACGNSGTPSVPEHNEPVANNEATPSENGTSYPIVIKHAFGETILEKKPERIATIGWGNQDVPLALGVIPVGVSTANYGVIDDSGLLPWTLAKFKALGVENPVIFNDLTELDFEGINDVQPDVILAAYSGITQEEYELLSEIAPVVAYPTLPYQTYWREQIILDAAGMGMQAEGEALVKELETFIEKKLKDYPQLAGKSAAFFYFVPSDLGKFYVYLPSDPRAAFLTDLGMVFPDSVNQLATASDSFALELSAENVDLLHDIDMILAYGNDELLAALQGDPLLGTVPAIKRGAVVLLEDNSPLAASGNPSALSIPATLDEYLGLIAEAADKVQ